MGRDRRIPRTYASCLPQDETKRSGWRWGLSTLAPHLPHTATGTCAPGAWDAHCQNKVGTTAQSTDKGRL